MPLVEVVPPEAQQAREHTIESSSPPHIIPTATSRLHGSWSKISGNDIKKFS
jgi:hypothetical protein